MAHTEWLPGVRLRHLVPPVQYMQRIVTVGGHPAVVTQWQSTGGSSQVSRVQLPVTAGLFTFLYFCLITPKFIYYILLTPELRTPPYSVKRTDSSVPLVPGLYKIHWIMQSLTYLSCKLGCLPLHADQFNNWTLQQHWHAQKYMAQLKIPIVVYSNGKSKGDHQYVVYLLANWLIQSVTPIVYCMVN